MRDVYGESYMRVFDAAMTAAVDAVHRLPLGEVERLTRHSGIVGLAAEHVLATKRRARRKTG